jgi:hypothetical protein
VAGSAVVALTVGCADGRFVGAGNSIFFVVTGLGGGLTSGSDFEQPTRANTARASALVIIICKRFMLCGSLSKFVAKAYLQRAPSSSPCFANS